MRRLPRLSLRPSHVHHRRPRGRLPRSLVERGLLGVVPRAELAEHPLLPLLPLLVRRVDLLLPLLLLERPLERALRQQLHLLHQSLPLLLDLALGAPLHQLLLTVRRAVGLEQLVEAALVEGGARVAEERARVDEHRAGAAVGGDRLAVLVLDGEVPVEGGGGLSE